MTTLIQVVFVLLALCILGAAVMVVSVRNIIHAALWLIGCFICIGALYFLMEAEFVAAAQVLIYAGAVSILILFAIMLTRHISGEHSRQLYRAWPVALGAAALLFVALIFPVIATSEWRISAGNTGIAGTREIGIAFLAEYLLPFEVASLVLLVALVGAIVVAFEERGARRRVRTLAEAVAARRQATEQEQGQP